MGTRSGNPLWKNGSTGGTPISAEALNRIEDALDSEDVYISELLEDSDSAINMSLKATIVSKIESYLDANPIAISADAGNAASLGSDGLVFVAPGAVDPSILGTEWVQATPLATWTIPHSLGRRPAVALYIGGESVEADVAATSTTVVITLPSPMAGTAVLT